MNKTEKHIFLIYFTGPGNSLKVLKTCKEEFTKAGSKVNLSEISSDEIVLQEADLIGFCFPVYAFGIPRIARSYLNSLQAFKKKQHVFILVTAGDSDESGFAIKECKRILRRKNSEIIYSKVIQMPVNWTTATKPPFPPSEDEAIKTINDTVITSKNIAEDILKGIKRHHRFNYPGRYSKAKFLSEYFLFKYLGVQNMWRWFHVYDTCNGCQLCTRICPTQSIHMLDHKPVWSKSCEQCMRCVNFCPKESIYQLQGGDTIGKNKYAEPSFKPKKRKLSSREMS